MECHWSRPNEVQRAAANALGLRRLQDWRRCEELNAPWILAQWLVRGHYRGPMLGVSNHATSW